MTADTPPPANSPAAGNTRIAHLRSLAMDEARDRLGMTWSEVADAAGISPQALRKIRSGDSLARTSTLRALEDALQLDTGSLSGSALRNSPEEVERRHRLARNQAMHQTTPPPAAVFQRPDGNSVLVEFKLAKQLDAEGMAKFARIMQAFADSVVEEVL